MTKCIWMWVASVYSYWIASNKMHLWSHIPFHIPPQLVWEERLNQCERASRQWGCCSLFYPTSDLLWIVWHLFPKRLLNITNREWLFLRGWKCSVPFQTSIGAVRVSGWKFFPHLLAGKSLLLIGRSKIGAGQMHQQSKSSPSADVV